MCSALLPLSSTEWTCVGAPSRMRRMLVMSFTMAALCSSGAAEYVVRKFSHRLVFTQASSSAVKAALFRIVMEAPY